MIALQNVTAGYDGRMVLHDVSFAVSPGEFLGILGPNGCGKTTLLRTISGVLRPQDGQIRIEGRDLRTVTPRELARTMACLTQEPAADFAFTVAELAMMGRTPHLSRWRGEKRRDREIVCRSLEWAGVAHLADRPITKLSGGERQRAFIAMCLAQEPRLLLLDEPTSHLDLGHQFAFFDLIGRLKRQVPLTCAAVLHDLNLAAEYCDRVLLLEGGRVVAVGSPSEVLTEETIDRVYGARVAMQKNPISGRPHFFHAAILE